MKLYYTRSTMQNLLSVDNFTCSYMLCLSCNLAHKYYIVSELGFTLSKPLIQRKLTVLNKAGLAVDDFSSTESTVLKVSIYRKPSRAGDMWYVQDCTCVCSRIA